MNQHAIKRFLLFVFFQCLLLGFYIPAAAEVRLPSILASGMVLQQNTTVTVWGWADAGEKVTVEASWLVEKPEVVAGADGKWQVKIPTGSAGGPHSLTISGENKVVLTDILFGEVWVCSGQSNMEFTIKMLGGWKYCKADRRDLRKNDYSAIRLCQVRKATSEVPVDTCSASWSKAGEQRVADFSATAFFFARTLYNWLHVPIGVISSNWGGTPAEAWTEKTFLEADPNLSYYLNAPNGQKWDAGKPSFLYNAMINPLLNYTIRGVIWYQGETNIYDADLYRELFTTTIKSWRKAWNLGDFPFCFVQIAPYDYGEPFPAAAYLREAQLKSLTLPNTGMAVTMDIGDAKNIHPKNKQEVGLRLGLLALEKTYRDSTVRSTGPVYQSMRREGSAIRLVFDNATQGLTTNEPVLTGFTIAGSDGHFRPALAKIDGNTVVVSNDTVEYPMNVRFAFTNSSPGALYNLAGLPASSFRTDSIPLLVRNVHIAFTTDSIKKVTTAALTCLDSSCKIRYTLDGSDPSIHSPIYSAPLVIAGTNQVKARAFHKDVASETITTSHFEMHLGVGKKISVVNPWSPRYAGGTNALLDGIRGSAENWGDQWQGYQGVDFEGIVDLGKSTRVSNVSVGFLQDSPSWIFLPEKVTLSYSEDGVSFIPLQSYSPQESKRRTDALIRNFSWQVNVNLRYLRIGAKNTGTCPSWHQGKGGKAWIFADEIVIK